MAPTQAICADLRTAAELRTYWNALGKLEIAAEYALGLAGQPDVAAATLQAFTHVENRLRYFLDQPSTASAETIGKLAGLSLDDICSAAFIVETAFASAVTAAPGSVVLTRAAEAYEAAIAPLRPPAASASVVDRPGLVLGIMLAASGGFGLAMAVAAGSVPAGTPAGRRDKRTGGGSR
jgi:hypothetical protein